jgi:protein-tyrosine phosphatase
MSPPAAATAPSKPKTKPSSSPSSSSVEQTLLTAFLPRIAAEGDEGSDNALPFHRFVFERDAWERKEQEREQREALEEVNRLKKLRLAAKRGAGKERRNLEQRAKAAELALVCEGRCVIDGLFVGSRRAAMNEEWIRRVGVSAVVNATADLSCYFESDSDSGSGGGGGQQQQQQQQPEKQRQKGESGAAGVGAVVEDETSLASTASRHAEDDEPLSLEYFRVPVSDDPSADILSHFRPAAAFVHRALTRADNVLVHCREGRSRSVSCVLAYLMLYQGKTLREALPMVRDAGMTVLRQKVNRESGDAETTILTGEHARAAAAAETETEAETEAEAEAESAEAEATLLAQEVDCDGDDDVGGEDGDGTGTDSGDDSGLFKTATMVFRAPVGVNDGFQRQLMQLEAEILGTDPTARTATATDLFNKSERAGRRSARQGDFSYSDDHNLKLSTLEASASASAPAYGDAAAIVNEDSMDRLLVEAKEKELHRQHEERAAQAEAERAQRLRDNPESEEGNAKPVASWSRPKFAEAVKAQGIANKAPVSAKRSREPASASASSASASSSSAERKRETAPSEPKKRRVKRTQGVPQSNTLFSYFTKP